MVGQLDDLDQFPAHALAREHQAARLELDGELVVELVAMAMALGDFRCAVRFGRDGSGKERARKRAKSRSAISQSRPYFTPLSRPSRSQRLTSTGFRFRRRATSGRGRSLTSFTMELAIGIRKRARVESLIWRA